MAGRRKMLISLTQRLRLENLDLRLLLIPRHAERRMEISKVLESSPLLYQMRTKSKKAPPDNVVYLADTTGEMTELLQVADLAFLGKTLPPNQGGQNPIEPIALSIPLVVGPNYQNFRETCADMFEHGCALRCADQSEIIKKIIALIQNQKAGIKCKMHPRNGWINKDHPLPSLLKKFTPFSLER